MRSHIFGMIDDCADFIGKFLEGSLNWKQSEKKRRKSDEEHNRIVGICYRDRSSL